MKQISKSQSLGHLVTPNLTNLNLAAESIQLGFSSVWQVEKPTIILNIAICGFGQRWMAHTVLTVH